MEVSARTTRPRACDGLRPTAAALKADREHQQQHPAAWKTHHHAHTAEAPAPTELTKNSVGRFLSDHRIVGLSVSLTDAQWARIEPLLPDRTPRRAGPWRDHRQVTDGIPFKYPTGTPWMNLPQHFDSWKGAHNRLRKWAADGTWEKAFTALLAQADAQGDLDWAVAADSTIVRAHQYAAPVRQKRPRPASRTTMPFGRSRGGLTTKIHLVADGGRRPLRSSSRRARQVTHPPSGRS
ncbi:IS5 family transposase [Streptomyces sp. DSM 41921]|uniref:IS5 family transposase n=1 Tax=Streptomyces dubilierae TaxID=3075533 RepID=A0ABU2PNV5_9ACTN|nr:IS5 family transposase [Streptomyces sp. DSM 41921]MDT0393005.1 IS5 family transposase [Streptomyces sp. DSM 41921]